MIKTLKFSLFLCLYFIDHGYFIGDGEPCTEVNWGEKDYLVMRTEKPLQSNCLPGKMFFNSDGQKFCLERPNPTDPSVLECSLPHDYQIPTSLRLPTNVVPVAYRVRLETDLAERKTAGYTSIKVKVTNPTRHIVLHADTKTLNIDESQVSFTRKKTNGDISEISVQYHLRDEKRGIIPLECHTNPP